VRSKVLVQRANGERFANEFLKEILTVVKGVVVKAIQLTTSFQEVTMAVTKIGICKHCVQVVILQRVVGFLVAR
jgi:hypothetical protein